jgi:hypothetical protein
MKLAQIVPEPGSQLFVGSSEFLTKDQREHRCQQLAAQGFLVAEVARVLDESHGGAEAMVAALTAHAAGAALSRPGRLREALEGAVEAALATHGAPPPSDEGHPDLRSTAHDQVLRARDLSLPGLCLVMPELSALADSRGVLDPADSAVLGVWW